MIYDSNEQKQLCMNAIAAYAMPIGQSYAQPIRDLIQQMQDGQVVAPKKPEPLKAVKKGKKK